MNYDVKPNFRIMGLKFGKISSLQQCPRLMKPSEVVARVKTTARSPVKLTEALRSDGRGLDLEYRTGRLYFRDEQRQVVILDTNSSRSSAEGLAEIWFRRYRH